VTPLVRGARQALAELGSDGLRLGVVTSGSRVRVARELVTLDLERLFTVLICSGEAARPKPAPEPLLLALEHLGVPAQEAAYVGDSPEDVQMARAAGVYAIGIPGGFPNREALQAAGPDHLADSLRSATRHLLTPRSGR
jgi:HAD superfamily hydrolase (TIGR01509 family)